MENNNQGKPMVSIIIPVYNSEKYLKHCVDSVLAQNYTDFELILVDDGSSDSSALICDGYAASDQRVRVMHRNHSGVSEARNAALAEARGTWIQFADSDDWLAPEATEKFVRAAEISQCDMVVSDFFRVAGERYSHKGDIDQAGLITRKEFADCMMENPADFYYGVLWNKLYRRDLIVKNDIKMNTDINWCEDFLFNLEYILFAEDFYILQTPIYYYRNRKGSLSSQGWNFSKTIQMKLTVFECYNDFYKNIYDEEDYRKKRLQIYRFLLDAADDNVVVPSLLSGSQKRRNTTFSVSSERNLSDDFLLGSYYDRKLLNRYLRNVALRNGLTDNEVTLLLYLSHLKGSCTRAELSDYTGLSRSSISRSLQKFSAREYIRISEVRKKESRKAGDARTLNRMEVHIHFLPASEKILSDLFVALREVNEVRLEGFTEEERASCEAYLRRIRDNMSRELSS